MWSTFPDNYVGSQPGVITTWRSVDGSTTSQMDYLLGDSEACRAWGGARCTADLQRSIPLRGSMHREK